MADQDDQLFLESIVENIPDMIFVKEAEELRFVRFNGAGERLLGISAEEMYGKNDYDFFPADEARFFTEKDREVLAAGKVVDIPFEPIHTAHGLRWLHTRKVPLKGPDGQPAFLLGISTDITESHQTQEELRVLLENFPGAVWKVDLESERVQRIAGEAVMTEEMVLQTARAGRDHEINAGDSSFECRVEHLETGGELVVALDVTERRRLETERMQSELRELQRMESLGLLAGGIAHDFNNLLVGMLGNASLALERVTLDSEARQALERLQRAAHRASDLSRQMLAYSGRGHFVVKCVDVSTAVAEMSELLRSSIGRQVALELQLPPDVGAVQADVTQFNQLMMNLITNASDAIGDRPGTISVTASTIRIGEDFRSDWLAKDLVPGSYVAVTVTDDGCGMDEATRARMFDPFYTTKDSGHGLGLAAALGIVRGHHGAVQVHSSLGKGTSIRVLLPSSARQADPTIDAPSPAPQVLGGRVLIIDDEPAVREFSTAALEYNGFDVTTAESGDAALTLEGPFDVVVLDLTMPGMSGLDTLRALHLRWPGLPVVLSSGFDQTEATRELGPGEVRSFLQKPYALRDLVSHVQGALS